VKGRNGTRAEQLDPSHSGSVPIHYSVHDTIRAGTAWIASAWFSENDGPADVKFVMHVIRGSQVFYWRSQDVPTFFHKHEGWMNAQRIFCTDDELLPGDELYLYIKCENYTSIQVGEFSLLGLK
jgi:hypothetical protein